MTPREYQQINVEYSKWRVTKYGFKITQVVPFVDDITSTGGNIAPSIEMSPINFFEVFVNKNDELPVYAVGPHDMPNTNMQRPFEKRSESTLKPVELCFAKEEHSNVRTTDLFQLEQSPNYGFINFKDNQFQYVHEVHYVDRKWTHALMPINLSWRHIGNKNRITDGYLTPYQGWKNCQMGRNVVDINIGVAERDQVPKKLKRDANPQEGMNYQPYRHLAHYARHPPPMILLRCPRIDRNGDMPVPYGFVMYVSYFVEIEGIKNHISPWPIVTQWPSHLGDSMFNKESRNQPTGAGYEDFIDYKGNVQCEPAVNN